MHSMHEETAAHRAAEEHLSACWEWLNDQDNEEPAGVPEPETLAPFCGCQTCEVREVLYAAAPYWD